jgi:transcriptional regulator with XRE-family HTH domain
MSRIDGKRIKHALMDADLGQFEAARKLGITRNILANIVSGRTRCSDKLAAQIANLCSVPITQLLGESAANDPVAELFRLRPGPTGRLRVVGAASAGPGNGDHPDYDELEGVPIELCRADYIGMSVQGDSMIPLLLPGDVAVFCEHHVEKYGYVWLIRKPDATVAVKRLVFDDTKVTIESLNPSYAVEDASGIELLGFLVGIWRTDGPETIIRHNPYGIKP